MHAFAAEFPSLKCLHFFHAIDICSPHAFSFLRSVAPVCALLCTTSFSSHLFLCLSISPLASVAFLCIGFHTYPQLSSKGLCFTRATPSPYSIITSVFVCALVNRCTFLVGTSGSRRRRIFTPSPTDSKALAVNVETICPGLSGALRRYAVLEINECAS